MFVGRVLGTVVATIKHAALAHSKLLVVQPYDPEGREDGPPVVALDQVDAGVGDRVLVLDEGSSASQILGRPRGPVRTLIVGVVDTIHVALREASPEAPPGGPTPEVTRG